MTTANKSLQGCISSSSPPITGKKHAASSASSGDFRSSVTSPYPGNLNTAMCGIVGYIGSQDAADILVNGLKRLEYRGYDSAGVAILNGGDIQLRRSVGKLAALEELLAKNPAHGTLGLGHTRWATH